MKGEDGSSGPGWPGKDVAGKGRYASFDIGDEEPPRPTPSVRQAFDFSLATSARDAAARYRSPNSVPVQEALRTQEVKISFMRTSLNRISL